MSEHIPKQENWGYPPMMCRCTFGPYYDIRSNCPGSDELRESLNAPRRNWFDDAKEKYQDKWRDVAKNEIKKMFCEKEEPKLKVSYKGVTGDLLKLERNQPKGKLIVDGVDYASAIERMTYTLEICDGHKHTFDSVDLKEVQLIGAKVTLA